MDAVPVTCDQCGTENLIDVSQPLSRSLEGNAVLTEYGYICPNCGAWEHSYYLSASLQDKINALKKLKPGSKKYQKQFAKVLSRFEKLQVRVAKQERDGALKSKDVVESR